MKRRNIAIMAMLALTAGQAFAQRCLPQMKGIEVKVGMADGVYNGKKSYKAGSQGRKPKPPSPGSAARPSMANGVPPVLPRARSMPGSGSFWAGCGSSAL